ncbi:hypothetical protein OF846_004989 [Rhodotorula toruloides]|nr:hypothetical protein OF846_004989 [Rhodotorula toruloides]
MTPVLPLELQLHILELALPPIIRRNLDERWRLQGDPADFGDLDEISMAFADFESFGVTSLRRLHIFDHHVRETAAMLYHLPPRLTYLAFHNGGFPSEWDSAFFAGLTTLVLEDIEECSWDILPRKTSLRILCLKSRHPAFESAALERMPFLEHIAVAAADTGAMEENFGRGEHLSLPPTLKLFSLVSSEEFPTARRAIEVACAQSDAQASIHVVSQEELEDWDSEEWAYSVGA